MNTFQVIKFIHFKKDSSFLIYGKLSTLLLGQNTLTSKLLLGMFLTLTHESNAHSTYQNVQQHEETTIR